MHAESICMFNTHLPILAIPKSFLIFLIQKTPLQDLASPPLALSAIHQCNTDVRLDNVLPYIIILIVHALDVHHDIIMTSRYYIIYCNKPHAVFYSSVFYFTTHFSFWKLTDAGITL